MSFVLTPESIHLQELTVIALKCSFTLFFLCGISLYKEIFSQVKKIPAKYILSVVLISIFGTGITAYFVPKTSRIYFDEQIYMQIAQHISGTGRAAMCADGTIEQDKGYSCRLETYNKQPNAYPYYLSLFYDVFGTSEKAAHIANLITLPLTTIALFFAVFFYFESISTAISSILIYNLTPMVLIWTHTVASEPITNLGIALSILAGIIFCKKKNLKTAILLATAVAISSQTRTEMFVTAMLVAPFCYFLDKNFWRNNWFLYSAIFFAFLMIPSVLHMYIFRNDPWGSANAKFSINYFLSNLKVNGPFYFANQRYPAIFGIFAFMSFFVFENWKKSIPLFTLFLFTWGTYLFFYAGSYNYGVDVRYSVLTAIPLSVLSAKTMTYSLSHSFWPRGRSLAGIILFSAVLISLLKFIPLIQRELDEAEGPRNDAAAVRAFQKLLPPRSMVFTRQVQMWLIQGQSAKFADIKDNFNKDVAKLRTEYPGGLYFHWGYWCNTVYLVKNSCENLFLDQKMTKMSGITQLGVEYALYKIEDKK